MKKLEKIGKSVLALSVLANTFMPLGMVQAEDDPPATYTVNITRDGSVELTKKNDLEIEAKMTAGNKYLTIQALGESNLDGITLDCNSNKETCTYTVPSGKGFKFSYVGTDMDVLNTDGEHGCLVGMEYVINHGGNFGIFEPSDEAHKPGQCSTEPNNNNNSNTEEPFDGKAVLVWSCNNKICYKEFTGLDQGTKIFYYQASSIKADNYPTAEFDVHADTKFFAPKSLFDKRKTEITASNEAANPTMKIDDLVGPPEKGGINYRPVNEPYETNAYVSYGDRNFKAIIYNNKFKALKMGNFEDLHYFPGAWENKLTRRESFDISDTTKANPVEFEMPLLESKFRLKVDEIGGLTVKSITPLDVPEGAVTVKKVDSEYEFKFNSRFYNKVVFKLVDEDDKEYFFRINRQAMSIKVDGDKVHDWTIYSDVYFDRNYNWDDLNITIKVVYKDGTSKLVEMENAKHIDDGLGNSKDIYENDEENPARTEWPVGRGLKRAVFKANFTNDEIKKIDKMYINIEYKSESNTFYAGNYAGSGKGEVIDFSGSEEYQRRMN